MKKWSLHDRWSLSGGIFVWTLCQYQAKTVFSIMCFSYTYCLIVLQLRWFALCSNHFEHLELESQVIGVYTQPVSVSVLWLWHFLAVMTTFRDYDRFWQLWQFLIILFQNTIVSCVVIWEFFNLNFVCFNISMIWTSENPKIEKKRNWNKKYDNSFNFTIGICLVEQSQNLTNVFKLVLVGTHTGLT